VRLRNLVLISVLAAGSVHVVFALGRIDATIQTSPQTPPAPVVATVSRTDYGRILDQLGSCNIERGQLQKSQAELEDMFASGRVGSTQKVTEAAILAVVKAFEGQPANAGKTLERDKTGKITGLVIDKTETPAGGRGGR
jgi:hypothetical protein